MGKEWLQFWGGGGGGSTAAAAKSTKKLQGRSRGGGGGARREIREAAAAAEVTAPTGCMCAVLQLFDLHQFQLALHHHQQPSFRPAAAPATFLHDEPFVATKGLEAPRNSLELDDQPPLMGTDSSSSSTLSKEQENLNIPVNVFQIKTTRQNKSPRASFSQPTARSPLPAPATDDLFSDSSSINSPSAAGGNKTPTLVARLMGLDQLPPNPPSPLVVQTSTITTPHSSASTSRSLNSKHIYHHPGLSGRLQILNQNRWSTSSSCGGNSHRSFFDSDITAGGGTGTVSLPETPRISSASSRRSDVDHGHRLSLQINKENRADEFELVPATYNYRAAATAKNSLARKRRQQLINKLQEERRSDECARELVKQVKESVSRKVCLLDITNTIKNRDQKAARTVDEDDHVVLLKPNKKPSKVSHESGLLISKQSTVPSSVSSRLLEPMNKKQPLLSCRNVQTNSQNQQQPQLQGKDVHCTVPSDEEQQRSVAVAVAKKCKKAGNDNYSCRMRKTPQALTEPILKKKEEPFIRPTIAQKGNNIIVSHDNKKCKRTPISNDIFNISVPTLLPVKKQQSSQASASISDGKRSTQLKVLSSCCSTQTYKPQQKEELVVTHMLNFQEDRHDDDRTITTAPTSSGEVVESEYRCYIQKVLKRAGIIQQDRGGANNNPLIMASKWNWYSPSHPLDPSIFHYIELFHHRPKEKQQDSELKLRCNRKLVFQVVDELLADILGSRRPPPRDHHQIIMFDDGSELMDRLWSRIREFPRADCKVLEDIDALIEGDLGSSSSSSASWCSWMHEEEGEGVVEEIERDIMKLLLHETTMEIRGASAVLSVRTTTTTT